MTAVAPESTPDSTPDSVPARAVRGGADGRRSWGVARTVLRVHRAALVVWALAVAGLSGWLVWLTQVSAAAEREAMEACERAGQDWCDTTMGWTGYSPPVEWIGLLTGYLFLAVAAFAGSALIGRELESGTARLAWTQGVSPTRWLAAKLAVPALVVTVGATALVLVYRWAWAANQDLMYNDWKAGSAFLSRGPTTVAYALCALAVGTLIALLLRRTLPALAVSIAATGLLGYLVAQFRSSFWPALTVTSTTQDVDRPDNAWELGNGAVIHGRRDPNFDIWQCDGTVAEGRRCLDDLGFSGTYVTYHPESHFWPLQLVESGVVLAVAAAATTAAFLLLRRRTA
ncbi:ABC transporter permease subunit [Streptomyces sp. NPDC006872]|uniref:ABC transporter permease subunit n=1 Tax=Streptomyces sp. NPDC006872 TaxID=3155720 RepID=UPI0033DBF8A6